jgi:hypothetical protein
MSSSIRWEPPVEGRRGPRLIRQPLRLALVIGAGLAIVGSFASWADGQVPGVGAVAFSSATTADGLLLPILALGSLGLALSEGVATSRTRTLQVSLAVLGIIAVLVWITALGSANAAIRGWQSQHGSGQIGAGILLAAAGVAVLAVTGVIISLHAWRTNGAAGDPTDVVITRRSIVRASIEVAGGVIGLVGGIVLGLVLSGPSGLALMAFGSMFGGAIGLGVGNRLGRLI